MIKNNKRPFSSCYYRRIDIVIPNADNRRVIIPKRQNINTRPSVVKHCQVTNRQPVSDDGSSAKQNVTPKTPCNNYILEQFSDNGKRRGRLLPWVRLSFSIIGCLSVVIISVLALVVIFKSNVKAEHSPVTVYASKPTEDSTDISKKRPAVNTYKYADDEPKSIEIHDIGVKNAILPLGLDKKNTLMAPENAYTAGWYNQSSKPGQKGAMLMDGHGSESGTYYGLFSRLSELEENDKITITRGDDRKFDFAVVKVENVPVDEVDMAKTLKPYNGAEQGLNIISCTGSWIKNHTTLDRRVILFAVPVNA